MDGCLLSRTGIHQVRACKGQGTKKLNTPLLVKDNMSHTPWVSSDAWGIFYFPKMSGSDKRIFVKKNNEQKCGATFDEKRPSGSKRMSAYTPSLKAKEP